jgi:WD40 repeat protein
MKHVRTFAALGLFALQVLLPANCLGDEPARPGIRALAFSPDGKALAAVTGEPNQPGSAVVWDLATRAKRWTHAEPTGIPAVAFAPDGQRLAIGLYSGAAKLLDSATGRELAALRHPKEVRAVAFSPDGKRLATACWDRQLRIWDLSTNTEMVKCAGHVDRIFTVAYSPDGSLLLSAGGSDGAKLWDAATGVEKRTWKHGNSFYMPYAQFTPDGQWALTAGYDGTARLWNVTSGELRAKFKGFGGVSRVAFSQAGNALAVGGLGGSVSLYDLKLSQPDKVEQDRIRSLVAKWDDPSYDAREAATKELRQIGLVGEPELRRLITESPSAEVRIRARRLRQDLLKQPRLELAGDADEVEGLAFSPDGALLATAGKEGIVRLFDVRTGKESARLAP